MNLRRDLYPIKVGYVIIDNVYLIFDTKIVDEVYKDMCRIYNIEYKQYKTETLIQNIKDYNITYIYCNDGNDNFNNCHPSNKCTSLCSNHNVNICKGRDAWLKWKSNESKR